MIMTIMYMVIVHRYTLEPGGIRNVSYPISMVLIIIIQSSVMLQELSGTNGKVIIIHSNSQI